MRAWAADSRLYSLEMFQLSRFDWKSADILTLDSHGNDKMRGCPMIFENHFEAAPLRKVHQQ